MPKPPPNPLLPAAQSTSLVDRINVWLHVRRYLKLFGRRWILVLAGAALGTGISAYRAYTQRDIYQAYSSITVSPRVQTGANTKVQYQDVLDEFYNRQIFILKHLVGAVEQKLAQERGPLAHIPDVRPNPVLGEGNALMLMVQSTDLKYARRFASIWADQFMDYRSNMRASKFGKTAATTSQQILDVQKKLQTARENIAQFRQTNQIADVQQTVKAAQRRLEELQNQQTTWRTKLQLLENTSKEAIADGALLAENANSVSSGSSSSGGNSTDTQGTALADPMEKFNSGNNYRQLKEQLLEDEDEYNSKTNVLRPRHPYMVRLRNQIQDVKQKIDNQLSIIEERRQALLTSYKRNADSCQPLIDAQKKKVLANQKIEYAYTQLQNEADGYAKELDTLQASLTSLGVVSSDDEGTFDIVARGQGSSAPIGPNRKKMILSGFLLGLGLGLGLAYLLQRLDDRLELAEDIENALQEPVLGQIPQMDASNSNQGGLLITRLNHHNMFLESLRGVRSAIMLGNEGVSKQFMLVSSAVPGDGKTTFTVNFAATLAMAGHHVLLVDADLRRGNTHFYFNHPREPGLAEVLQGELHWMDVIQETSIPTLHVINSGKLPPNPGELMVSPIAQQLFEEVREHYDFIIVDCPPLTAIDDAFSLAPLADGLVFVVRSGQTSMRFAKNSLNAVRQRGARILGVVVNGITADNPYYYYNHYYHSYYSKALNQQPADESVTAKPAAKMAQPKTVRHYPRRHPGPAGSIDAEARALASQSAEAQPTELGSTKAVEYKQRRAARLQEGNPNVANDPPAESTPLASPHDPSNEA